MRALWGGGAGGLARRGLGGGRQAWRPLSGATPTTRRRGGGGGEGAGPVKTVNFALEIDKVLNQVWAALDVGIMPLNAEYKLTRNQAARNESISLDAGDKGFYIFSVDWANELLTVQTPISGVRQYGYAPEEGTWLNNVDGHDMRGLITRDLLRHSRGCPKF